MFFTCDEGVEPIPLPLRGEYSERAEAMWRTQRESGVSLPPHVLVVMIDAVSRPQFIRALPKTLGVLLHHDSQSAFDFQRFSIVGAYSPPNRYAFFSGYPFPDPQVYFNFVFLFAHIFPPPPQTYGCQSQSLYPDSPFQEMAGIDYTKTKRQNIWMWELYKQYGYVTFSARDFCSRLRLLPYAHSLSRTPSLTLTHTHVQSLGMDVR